MVLVARPGRGPPRCGVVTSWSRCSSGSSPRSSLGLGFGLLRPEQLLYIDGARYSARGLLLEGLERGVGVSVFTLLLMGLVATVEATGFVDRLVTGTQAPGPTAPRRASGSSSPCSRPWPCCSPPTASWRSWPWGPSPGRPAQRLGLTAYRRANLLDLTACTWPFLLP